MKNNKSRKPLGTISLIFTLAIFLIMMTVMTLQAFLMYLYWRLWWQADIPMPQFWRPIPLLAVLSAVLGTGLAILVTRIPLKPIRKLIDAINLLAAGDFHVRIHLNLTEEFVKLSDSFNRMAQELENTELLRSDFINNFSHEFKTPIVSLRGFAKLLKNHDLSNEERDEYLDIIIHESWRLSQLASNVLNLSKIENLSILNDMGEFNLSEEIRLSILLLEGKWQKKELDLDVNFEELFYWGNKDLLNQVWINLMDNAIKFSYDKGIIELKLNQQNGWVEFQITDHGCGMKKEVQDHIFDRFYQGDVSHTTEGNGLGLTVVKRIVELHKGQLTVDSREGAGTTFVVTLPVTAEGDATIKKSAGP